MNATSLQTINSRDRKYKWIHSKFSDNCSRKCHCLIRSIEQENTFHARLQCKHKSANIRTHALEPRLSEQIELVCVAYHAWFWGIRWCSPHNTCMNYATIYFYQHKPWSCRYFFFFWYWTHKQHRKLLWMSIDCRNFEEKNVFAIVLL